MAAFGTSGPRTIDHQNQIVDGLEQQQAQERPLIHSSVSS
jgi:hypothetical protein